MKTLKQWNEEIWATNRIQNEATKKEIIEVLDIIAQDMMTGKTTMAHANTCLAVRSALMNQTERAADYKSAAAELGSIKTDRKAKSSAVNGKLGGRPKKQS